MKCEKCGTEVPENTNICPQCGAELSRPEAEREEPAAAVRPQTVPQRPHTEYPAKRRAVKRTEEEKPERQRDSRESARRWRTVRRAALAVVLLLLAGAIVWGAVGVVKSIMANRQEEPALSDVHAADGVRENESSAAQDTQTQDTAEPEIVAYDLAGVWIWDADAEPLSETVWSFEEDGSLLIYYFGIGEPENPFAAWPETYTYDRDKSQLLLAGETVTLQWKSENSFRMESGVLGACTATRTDADHIPTGAVDIRRAAELSAGQTDPAPDETEEETGGTYYFADSDRRYLKKSECQALTADELRIARNEIYARHGRKFDSADLQAYFDAQDWYEGTTSPANFNYNVLNDFERYNVNLMKTVEDAKRG